MKPSLRTGVSSAVALLLLASCGDWFGKDACKAGQQSCEGKQILSCAADVTTGETKWQRFGSCGITGPNLVCALVDGLAECVPDLSMDAGAGEEAGASSKTPMRGSETAFGQSTNENAAQVEWARLEVRRSTDGAGYEIADVASATLGFAPSGPVAGEVAAVAYAGTIPVDATLVAFQGKTRATTAWLRASGVTRVSLMASSGEVLAERTRSPARPSVSNAELSSLRQSLTVSLPATLKVYEGGQDLGWIAGVDAPTKTVVPTEEMLRLVGDALNRLPPIGASTITHVAFTSDNVSFTELVKQLHVAEVVETVEGGTVRVRAGEPSDGGIPASKKTAPFPSIWFSDRARASLSVVGQMLVVNVSDGMMTEYRADPSLLTLEILRHVGAVFVQLTSNQKNFFEARVKFPKDFSPEVERLIRESVTPLLLPLETFTTAWEQLHDVAVQANLADSYLPPGSRLPDDQALTRGVAAGPGVQGAGADFAEFVARVNVPERWSPSPCPDIRGKPIEQVPPRRLVHLSKLEMAWGLGYVSTETLKACVGDLNQGEAPPGIQVHTTDAGVLTFDRDVLGSQAPFMNGETHLTIFGRRQDGTQATVDTAYRGQPGVFRLVPSNRRSDARLGAGFYLMNPKTDSRSQAAGGVLLVRRADSQRLEVHALMVHHATNILGSSVLTEVFPLIVARYEIPEDQSEIDASP